MPVAQTTTHAPRHYKRKRGEEAPDESTVTPGKVYVASMKMRGEWAPRPKDAVAVNVTSAQGLRSRYRRDFSPMTEVPGLYNGYSCFENYWQSLKRYHGMPAKVEETVAKWWLRQGKGKRRCSHTNGYVVSHAQMDDISLGYVDSRKQCYVPKYEALCKDTESAKECKQRRKVGVDQVFFDFDGPRDEQGGLACVEVTPDSLRAYINNTTHPFGHGWVVAAVVAGVDSSEYTSDAPIA